MRNLQNFLFFNESTEAGSSNVLFHSFGSDLIVQVDSGVGDTFTLTISGKVNDELETWTVLKGVNMNDFSTLNSITANGIYSFGVSGINHIKATLSGVTGTVTVFGKVTE